MNLSEVVKMCSGNSKSADDILSICMQNSIEIEMGRVTLFCVFRTAVLIYAPYVWTPFDWLTNYSRYRHDTQKQMQSITWLSFMLYVLMAQILRSCSLFTEWNSFQIKFDVRSACIGGQHCNVHIRNTSNRFDQKLIKFVYFFVLTRFFVILNFVGFLLLILYATIPKSE